MKPSKRYLASLELVDKDKVYSKEEAVDVLKMMQHTKFDPTLEFSCKLNVDPKQSDQIVRGSVVLPHGRGKKVKVTVFCEGEKEQEAREAGADYVGGEELINKVLKEGWLDFDYCISTPSMMRVVSKLGRILGPRGMMPSPKTGTVTEKITAAVKEIKQGKVDFRMDKFGCIHAGLGKISFSKEALLENLQVFLNALRASRPAAVKGEFIKSCWLSTTMSPSLKIEL
jgi:large subunit ribosomal protein L1